MNIPADFAQANFKFTGPGLPTGAEMTLGLDIALWGSTPAALATGLAADWTTSGMPSLQTNKATLSEIDVKFGPTATGPTGTWTGNIVGTVSAESVSPNTSVLLTKLTAFGGRAGKGRFYLPGVAESEVTSAGQLTSPYISAANAALISLLTKINARDVGPVVLHGIGSPLSVPSPITSIVCASSVATQRRRLRR